MEQQGKEPRVKGGRGDVVGGLWEQLQSEANQLTLFTVVGFALLVMPQQTQFAEKKETPSKVG